MSDPIPARGRPITRAEALTAAAVFLGLTIVLSWPIAARIDDGLADLWDAKLTAWILHWDFHQTFRDPGRLFDANIFHPARDTLAFSENLLGVAVFGFPLYAAGLSTLAVYNVLFLFGMFLSAIAAWALARYVTGDAAASLLAGVVYAYLPWRMSQIAHIQFQWGGFLALALLFLLRYLDLGHRRDLVMFAVCLAWNASCNVHYAIFSVLLVGTVLVFRALEAGRSSRRRVAEVSVAAALAAIAIAPLFLPYARASRTYGMHRSESEARFFSGRWSTFLDAGSFNRLYGPVLRRWERPEGAFFPGFVPLALAAGAFRRRRSPLPSDDAARAPRRRARRTAARVLDGAIVLLLAVWAAALLHPGLRFGPLRLGDPSRVLVFATVAAFGRMVLAFPVRSRYGNLGDLLARAPVEGRLAVIATIGVLGVVVALGLHTPYYGFLFRSFGFLFRAVRAPSRGIVLFDLALAVLAAEGLSRVVRRAAPLRRATLVAGALVLTAIEYRAAPIAIEPVSPAPRPVDLWIGDRSLPGAVMEWPLGLQYDFEYEFRSTAHWKPLVNGASGFVPLSYRELLTSYESSGQARDLWDRVRAVDACVLVFHPHDAPASRLYQDASRLREGVDSGRLEVIGALPHGVYADYVFRIASGETFDSGFSEEERRSARRRFLSARLGEVGNAFAPLAALDFPRSDAVVHAGDVAYGWAYDDSGIREIRVATEKGDAGLAVYGGPRPDVGRALPALADAAHSGFYFAIPALPPGRHTLIVTAMARNGRQRTLSCPVRVP